MKLIPCILLDIRIHLYYGRRIGEQSVLLLETYGKACILSLMRVRDIESAVGLVAMLPHDVLVGSFRCAEHLVEEVGHLLSRFLQVSQAFGIVPTEDVLESAAFKPHLIRLFSLQHFHVDIVADGL